ncbi:MAG TPA: STAS domain-containing protein [Gemmataceae bacterium]|jgi:anti-anti-sigma factor|nr:STAS domain-containing protein [Gemmataceae bacterium]
MATDAPAPMEISRTGDRTTARFAHLTSLNEYHADLTGKQLLALADPPGTKLVSLDLANVEYLTSTVLGHLVGLHRRLLKAGGRLTLENVRPAVKEILRVTQLDQVLDQRASA